MGILYAPACCPPPISIRTDFARKLLAALWSCMPDSRARLRGSLASGTADKYSDIDLAWEIPDDCFQKGINTLVWGLRSVGETESLRTDPEFRESSAYRLIFIRYKGLAGPRSAG
jgi:predicted nucleotidyltransferase